MIDIDRLRQLVDLMVEHDLTEVDVSDEDQSITIKRGMGGSFAITPQPVAAVAPTAPAAAPVAAPATSAPAAPAADDGLVAIESPMVGTFYSAPDPDSPPFAAQGASIGPDSVVCLVEAMKVFNEIKAETSGTIERVCVKDGDAIEFGQALFMVRPA
ncbi:MAG: acetyl-CoA carboxylase biotin carboxyl carrier protein [Phycisphaerales bacterium]|nr:acetyl-CoA carboxylase biotin carboxyl carrier protein [Phycisphaerales bacterium]